MDVAYHHKYPAICLGVIAGNSAGNIYHKLGILSGVSSSEFKLAL